MHAFVDGYHLGLIVTILLLAAGVVVSYLTLRPRAVGAAPADQGTAVGEIEAVGESLGEFVSAEGLVTAVNGDGDVAGSGGVRGGRAAVPRS